MAVSRNHRIRKKYIALRFIPCEGLAGSDSFARSAIDENARRQDVQMMKQSRFGSRQTRLAIYSTMAMYC